MTDETVEAICLLVGMFSFSIIGAYWMTFEKMPPFLIDVFKSASVVPESEVSK